MRGLMKRLMGVLLCLLLTGAGCVIIPVPEREVVQGRQFKTEDTEFLKAGVTTRQEVLGKFGEPTIDFKSHRVFAYSWYMLNGYLAWFIGNGYSGGGGIQRI